MDSRAGPTGIPSVGRLRNEAVAGHSGRATKEAPVTSIRGRYGPTDDPFDIPPDTIVFPGRPETYHAMRQSLVNYGEVWIADDLVDKSVVRVGNAHGKTRGGSGPTHNEIVDQMHEHHRKTGQWIDPVTKAELPTDGRGRPIVLVKDPNRKQRRDLAKWRRRQRRR